MKKAAKALEKITSRSNRPKSQSLWDMTNDQDAKTRAAEAFNDAMTQKAFTEAFPDDVIVKKMAPFERDEVNEFDARFVLGGEFYNAKGIPVPEFDEIETMRALRESAASEAMDKSTAFDEQIDQAGQDMQIAEAELRAADREQRAVDEALNGAQIDQEEHDRLFEAQKILKARARIAINRADARIRSLNARKDVVEPEISARLDQEIAVLEKANAKVINDYLRDYKFFVGTDAPEREIDESNSEYLARLKSNFADMQQELPQEVKEQRESAIVWKELKQKMKDVVYEERQIETILNSMPPNELRRLNKAWPLFLAKLKSRGYVKNRRVTAEDILMLVEVFMNEELDPDRLVKAVHALQDPIEKTAERTRKIGRILTERLKAPDEKVGGVRFREQEAQQQQEEEGALGLVGESSGQTPARVVARIPHTPGGVVPEGAGSVLIENDKTLKVQAADKDPIFFEIVMWEGSPRAVFSMSGQEDDYSEWVGTKNAARIQDAMERTGFLNSAALKEFLGITGNMNSQNMADALHNSFGVQVYGEGRRTPSKAAIRKSAAGSRSRRAGIAEQPPEQEETEFIAGRGLGPSKLPLLVPFGEILLNPRKLNQEHVLSVKSKRGSSIYGFRNKKVSAIFVDFVMKILQGRKVTGSDYARLSSDEKILFDKLCYVSKTLFQLPTSHEESIEKLKAKFTILQGEYISGNDAIRGELVDVLHKLFHFKVISSRQLNAYIKQI